MNRQDLINYKNDKIWIKDQIEYIKEQKETINQLSIHTRKETGNGSK